MIKLITLLVSFSLIGLIKTNPVPEDPSVDWSTRISDNVESLIGPTKFNFDDSSEEIDSTFAKREASPISGPLDAPLGWGARIESSSSAVGGSGDVSLSSSSSSSGTGAVSGGAGGGIGSGGLVVGGGGDNKQKVDWALNPGDNKKLYSSNDTPDVIEQKKEETLPLAPETSKPSEESNPDPYKNILPAVLTGKRRLAEDDKPVQSSPSSPSLASPSVSSEGDVSPTVKDSKEKVTSLVESKGHSGGQVFPYDGPYHLKPNDGKSIPQHVYTEDQFPSVITIKGREYLVIPHKSNTARPSAAQTSPGSPWYSIPVQGQFVQSGQFGSQFFNPNSPYQSNQAGHGSKSNQSSPPVAQPTVADVPSSGHHQFVSSAFTGGYPGHSSNEFARPSFPQHPGASRFTWSSRYPVYHSSVFTNPNVQQSGPSQSPSTGQFSENSIPSVFSSFFPQYGQYPSSSPVIKNFEFFTPPSHTVSVSSTGSSPGSSVAASPQGEIKDNPTFVPDPSFSPKLQDSFQSSPSVVGNGGGGGGGVIINTQQESFVTKQPIKPESNLHAPPQIPTWNPFGFSVVAGSYPVQSPSPSVSVSTSSSSVSSSSPLSPTSSSSSSSFSSSSSKTHAESPVTVTVDTKFPPSRSPSSSSSSGNNGVKGGSTSVESSSPSITVGSFNVDSAADQPVAKGPQQTQQQDQQQVGVAGENLVPTTIVDVKNQFLPNSPFLSSSGYFVSSPPVNQASPSSVYPTSSTSVSSSSPPSPGSIPQLGFPDQRHFLAQPWQSPSSGYNYPSPASPPSPYFDPVNPVPTPSWDYPFYHQFQQEAFYNQRGTELDQPDFDLNQVPSAKILRSSVFAN